MTELKTLKKINEEFLQEKGYHIFVPAAVKLLRQEAIKNVKTPKLEEYFLSGRIDILPVVREIVGDGMKTWIKHFFNITEEDLK